MFYSLTSEAKPLRRNKNIRDCNHYNKVGNSTFPFVVYKTYKENYFIKFSLGECAAENYPLTVYSCYKG